MEQPILIYQKNADKYGNKMIIPQVVVDMFGRSFYMKIYEDKIVLEPINKELNKNKKSK